ncbi:Dioxygenase [Novipirellula aureliae]|uniref:Dioxygenase n=2 Tax=Novipirellula aureliae TaxID=2527966 RepID=A0A5C6EAY0_9BACT|nr:Dioxygenase [Novipirellula aureliae]
MNKLNSQRIDLNIVFPLFDGPNMRFIILASMLSIIPSLVVADDLRGTIIDGSGKPIGGARIDISTAAPKSGPAIFCPSCYLDCAKSAVSGEQGSFEIRDVSPDLQFRLVVTAVDKITVATSLIDPSIETPEITLQDFPADVSSDHLVHGVVRSELGVPVSGALIDAWGATSNGRRWRGRVDGAATVVSDDQGRFRMLLTEDYEEIDLQVTADGYAGVISEPLNPGDESHAIVLPSGAVVKGKVVQDGRPLPGEPIAVVQVNRGRLKKIFLKAILTTTDQDGSFEFTALPADDQYAVFTPVEVGSKGPVIPTGLFALKEDGSTLDLGVLEAAKGVTISGAIKVSGQSALPDAIAITLDRMPAWDLIEVPVDDDGRFEMTNLPPETYEVRLKVKGFALDHEKMNYQLIDSTTIAVRLDKSIEDIDVWMRPLDADETALDQQSSAERLSRDATGNQKLSGIVVDVHGQPVPNLKLTPKQSVWGPVFNRFSKRTKSDGSFSFEGLPDVPLELFFYNDNVRGYPLGDQLVSALYPGLFRCKLNQSDIRIVYDSQLAIKPNEIADTDE